MQETKTIDRLYMNIKSKIRPYWLTAFSSCMIIGLLTYGYFWSNHFLTYDSMWNLYSDQNMITSGRQFLQWACGIGSYYDLPWLNGVLAIFYLAVTSVLVVEGLGIRSHIHAALAAGIIVTFPSVISTFGYSYTVDGYMLAALLAAAAFLVTDRFKWGVPIGLVLLGVALGIYQAFLSFAIVLCILRLLLDILDNHNMKNILIKAGKFILMGIGAYIFYLVTLNVMLSVQGTELSGYQGVDKVQGISLSALPEGLWTAFKTFFAFLLHANVLTTTIPMKIAVIILFMAGIGLYFYYFIKKKCYKNLYNVLLTIGLVAAIPFGATAVSIISPDTFHHLLLRGCWSLFFVFIIALAERMVISPKAVYERLGRATVILVSLCSMLLILEFSKMANIAGYNQNERYEKTYSLCLRIADRLEQTPGFEHGMPLAILGGVPAYPSTDITRDDLIGYFGVTGDYTIGSTEHFAEFMSHYMNITLNTITFEEELELVETEEFKNCPKFPDEECIMQIDGVWVIKING